MPRTSIQTQEKQGSADYEERKPGKNFRLGRYSQRITILRALAEGLAGRVQSHLQRALALAPRHAEAHVALGLYHAEIVNKLGSLAASLTYGASRDKAIEHFQHAI